MCWGGSGLKKEDLDKAREKELLLLMDHSDDEDEGGVLRADEEQQQRVGRKKTAAYVPQHAAASFLRTATPKNMRRANESV